MCDIEGEQDLIDKERSRGNLDHEGIDMEFGSLRAALCFVCISCENAMDLSFSASYVDHTSTMVLVLKAKLHPIGSQWRQSTHSPSVYIRSQDTECNVLGQFLKPAFDAG